MKASIITPTNNPKFLHELEESIMDNTHQDYVLYVSSTAKTTITTPTGYSLIYKVESNATYLTWGLYYKIVTSGDIGESVTVNLGASGLVWLNQTVYTTGSSNYFNTVGSGNYDRVSSSTLFSPSITNVSAGSPLYVGLKMYPSSVSTWEHSIATIRDTFDCDLRDYDFDVRVKLYGYEITETRSFHSGFNQQLCDTCP